MIQVGSGGEDSGVLEWRSVSGTHSTACHVTQAVAMETEAGLDRMTGLFLLGGAVVAV